MKRRSAQRGWALLFLGGLVLILLLVLYHQAQEDSHHGKSTTPLPVQFEAA